MHDSWRRKAGRLSSQDRLRLLEEKDKFLKKISVKLDPVERTAQVTLADGKTHLLLFIGDVHLGSSASDLELLKEMLQLAKENESAYIVFLGDEKEGVTPEYLTTIIEQLTLFADGQDEYWQGLIKELLEKGKVLAVLTRYKDHHATHPRKHGAASTYNSLLDYEDVHMIGNGSIINLKKHSKNAHGNDIEIPLDKIRTFHNISRFGGSPKGNFKTEAGLSGSASIIVAAHEHTTHAASAVKTYNPEGDTKTAIKGGAFKGRSRQDMFFVQELAGKQSAPPGASVLYFEYEGKQISIALPEFERTTKVLYESALLFEAAQANGAYEDYKEKIEKQLHPPEVTFFPNKSKRPKTDPGSPESPYWDEAYFDVNTALPLVLYMAQEYRLGSKYADTSHLKKIVTAVTENPYARLVLGRKMIDREVPKRADRETLLKDLVKLLAPLVGENESTKLLVMLWDTIWGHSKWKEPVRRNANGEFLDPNGILPSTIVEPNLHMRYMQNGGDITLNLHNGGRKKQDSRYVVRVFDENVGGGSKSPDPTEVVMSELRRNDLFLDTSQVTVQQIGVGGQVALAGHGQEWNPKTGELDIVIAPGSNATEARKGASRLTPTQGEFGVVLWPDRRLATPFASKTEADAFFALAFLHSGLKHLDLLDEANNKFDRRKGKRE